MTIIRVILDRIGILHLQVRSHNASPFPLSSTHDAANGSGDEAAISSNSSNSERDEDSLLPFRAVRAGKYSLCIDGR